MNSQWKVIASGERIHHIDHVLALGLQAGVGAVPGVAAIQQDCIGTVGANGIDDRRHTVHATHAPIGLRQRRKVTRAERVVRRRAVGDPVKFPEIGAGDMRNGPLVAPYTRY